ncbi:replicative DNA helicase [Riemerella anatipestifer]|uniref:replicative DNA helicase n=1 Tax=Riemerella anatipestifer TaxID=34085 RepID=UPI00129E1825|nr:replicative DNA helicase [Riemerella anatipestifer]MRM93744.1 replicative DNA helicase [Riemerella anatipestifer]
MSYKNGVTPPNSVDVEKLILGACLISETGKERVLSIFKDKWEMFYDPRHIEIYKSMCELNSNNEPIDLATVIENLKKRGKLNNAGGDGYIIDLTIGISSAAHIEHYCLLVSEKFFLRKMIEVSTKITEKAYKDDGSTFDLLNDFSFEIGKIYDYIAGQKAIKSSKDLHLELIENQKKGMARGVPIPFQKMDNHFYGWQPTDLIIIGARPGMGKSAYAMELARCASKNKVPTLIFSLEMANIQLHTRLVANELEIDSNSLRKHNLSDSEWSKIYDSSEIEQMPLYYEDSVFDLNGIISKARVAKKELGVKFIIIDYLQLIEAKGKSEGNEKVSFISRKLKMLAKELNVPVVVLSQLSRSVETRPNKRPQLSDLRDSGAIEQDADVIQFIYRPEYYGIEIWDVEWSGISDLPTEGEAEIITAKHRHVGTSETRLKWIPKYQKFKDIDDNTFEPLPTIDLKDAF